MKMEVNSVYKRIVILILCFLSAFNFGYAQQALNQESISNSQYTLSWSRNDIAAIRYTVKGSHKSYSFQLPSFEIDNKTVPSILKELKPTENPSTLKNGVTEYVYEGVFKSNPSLYLTLRFQVSPDNPVLRLQYSLRSRKEEKLTKRMGKDAITYLSFQTATPQVKEVRFSEFNERFHATHKTEAILDERYFSDTASFMGPMLVAGDGQQTFLVAYEHGSQYPDRFLQFQLQPNKKIELQSVKGNYLNGQEANGFTSVWFDIAATDGGENALAQQYRNFVLKYLTQNEASRRPYIFYNTWGRQERVQWTGQKYLSSMNLDWTLKEIDRAHAMGIEVYVLDAGWFNKTGDWEVNKNFFPDELKQVKAKLDEYGMKLGLWFNPTVAAISSNMYKRNLDNRMSWNGKYGEPHEIWETENSVGLCLVSSYWEDFANKLIQLSKTLGVTYFKWDAIGQYGCNDPHHFHGTEKDSPEERAQRYAFLQPLYMTKIVNRLCKEVPNAIVDFDITEDGRCVGLQFLSAGKYFIINNGPYYHNDNNKKHNHSYSK